MADAWLSGFSTGNPPVTLTTPTIYKDGGYSLEGTIGGAGLPDGEYNVFVGPLGTIADPICYSGISGEGSTVEVLNNAFSCISPILPIGGPYPFTFVNLDTQAVDVTAPALTAVAHPVRSLVLAYRGLLPRNWITGYRNLDQFDYPQV